MSEQTPNNQNNPSSQGPQRGDWWETRREWRREWRGNDPFRAFSRL